MKMGAFLAAGLLALAAPALADPPQRIVSVGGSVTEIVAALGAADLLVGRDSTSTWPPEVAALPDVGYFRALSPEGVLGLAPDLVLAEADAGPVEAVEVLKAAGIPYVALPGEPSPEGIAAKITAVGEAIGRQAEAATLAETFAAEIAAVRGDAAQVPAADRKRVLFVLANQAGRLLVGGEGSSAAAIIELAGGVNAGTGFHGYKQATDEAILTSAPDVILMMDREGDLAISDAEVLGHPALGTTPAAQAGAILRMDGLLLLGFGPRTAQAARQLHDALYGPSGG